MYKGNTFECYDSCKIIHNWIDKNYVRYCYGVHLCKLLYNDILNEKVICTGLERALFWGREMERRVVSWLSNIFHWKIADSPSQRVYQNEFISSTPDAIVLNSIPVCNQSHL